MKRQKVVSYPSSQTIFVAPICHDLKDPLFACLSKIVESALLEKLVRSEDNK